MPKLRHLAIVTPNRERLVKFYADAFDLKVIYGRPHSTHLSDGNFNLAIVDKIGDAKAGFYVIGFDVDDISDLAGTLKNAGGSRELSAMPQDHDAEYRSQDPEGNRLDLAIQGWCVV
jgi:predicted enzyme related to lactoylglutathione lyase